MRPAKKAVVRSQGKRSKRRARTLLVVLKTAAILALAGCAAENVKPRGNFPAGDESRLAAFHYKLACEFWSRNRIDLALKSLEMAVQQNPELAAPRLRILDLYLFHWDCTAALAYLEECPEALKDQPEFLKRKALAMELSGQGEEAGRLLARAAALDPVDPALPLAAAENLLFHGRAEEVLPLLELAGELHPDHALLLLSLADLYRLKDRSLDEGETRLRIAGLLAEDTEQIRGAARAFEASGHFDEGIGALEGFAPLAAESQRAAVEIALARLYRACGRFRDAADRFQRAFRYPGYKPETEEILGYAETRMRLEEFDKAIPLLLEALDQDPDQGVARAALAWAYHRQGDNEEARRVVAGGRSGMAGEDLLKAVVESLEGRGRADR